MLPRANPVFHREEGICAMTLLPAIVILGAIASAARAAGSPLIWSTEVAQPLFLWRCVFAAAPGAAEKPAFRSSDPDGDADRPRPGLASPLQSGGAWLAAGVSPHLRVAQHGPDASPALPGHADARVMASRIDGRWFCGDAGHRCVAAFWPGLRPGRPRKRRLTLALIAVPVARFLVIGLPVAFALGLAAIPVFVATGTMPPTGCGAEDGRRDPKRPAAGGAVLHPGGNLMKVAGIN